MWLSRFPLPAREVVEADYGGETEDISPLCHFGWVPGSVMDHVIAGPQSQSSQFPNGALKNTSKQINSI